MGISRRYLTAVVLLAVLAVAFGVFGTVAPPLAEENTPVQPAQESSSESVGHFTNPPTYDSGWVDIRDKYGQSFSLKHNLNTTDVVVDIAGKQDLDPTGGRLTWGKTYGGAGAEIAYSMVQTNDGGYALAGETGSFGAGDRDFWLVKTNSAGIMQWNKTYGGTGYDCAYSLVQTADGGYAFVGYGFASLVKTDSYGTMLWSRIYTGAEPFVPYSLVQTDDGGYALAGYTASFGFRDFWLAKTNSAGILQWNKTYGGTSEDWAYSLVQTPDGGYALAGYTSSFGAGRDDFWLVKTDASGTMQWNRTYGGTGFDQAYSLIQTDDGGYALAGYTYSQDTGIWDLWLVKTDASGTMQWNRTYGGELYPDYAYSVVQTSDGGYALAGLAYISGAVDFDFWLVKTNSAGIMQWSKTYGGAGRDEARSLVQTGDGDYALVGYTNSFGAGNNDFWLVKVKPEMNLEHQRYFGGTILVPGWSKTYGGTSKDTASSLVQTLDGGYALAGATYSFGAGGSDVWLVKTDSAGNMLWSKTYGGTSYDEAYSVVQTGDGGYAIAGSTASYGAGRDDCWLVKTDSYGNMLWSKTFGGADNDCGHSVIQTSDGGYAITGHYGYFHYCFPPPLHVYRDADLWLIKTDASGNLQWDITFGGSYNDCGHSVIQTSDGGYAITGYYGDYLCAWLANSYPDCLFVKTNADGSSYWYRTYEGGFNWGTSGYCLIQTDDRGYVLGGEIGVNDLLKIDPNGNIIWSKSYAEVSVYSFIQTGDGGYALAGQTSSDFLLAKTDETGNILWSRTYGGASYDYAYSMVQTGDGGYALAGYTASFGAGSDDCWLVKSDVEMGLARTGLTNNSITLYRGKTDLYWNYVRVRIWLIKEPTWIYGDINMDGVVDSKDLYIIGRNYGKTFSLLSLSGIIAIAGIHTVKNKRKQSRQPSYIS